MKLHACFLLGLSVAAISGLSVAQDYETPMTEWGVPDLRAVWKHATIMPLERPRDLGTKQSYTEEEAIAIERGRQEFFDADNEPLDPDRPAPVVADSLPPDEGSTAHRSAGRGWRTPRGWRCS